MHPSALNSNKPSAVFEAKFTKPLLVTSSFTFVLTEPGMNLN
jgi:hypothetical protein